MKNISNLKRSLETLRKRFVDEINFIDKVLKDFNEFNKKTTCPNCFSRDLRVMKNDKIFCRACGYDNRLNNKGKKK